jgi:hypothetical protein
MITSLTEHDFIDHDLEDREDFAEIVTELKDRYPLAEFRLRYNYISDLTVVEFESKGVRYWASELAEDESSIYNSSAYRQEHILKWMFKVKNIMQVSGPGAQLFGIYTALPLNAVPRTEFSTEDLPRLCGMIDDLGEVSLIYTQPTRILEYVKDSLYKKLDQLAAFTAQSSYLEIIKHFIDTEFTPDDLCLTFKDTPLQLSETKDGALHVNGIGVVRAGFKRSINIPYFDDNNEPKYHTHLPKSWAPSTKIIFMTDLYAMLRFVELRWQNEDPGEFINIDFTHFFKYID